KLAERTWLAWSRSRRRTWIKRSQVSSLKTRRDRAGGADTDVTGEEPTASPTRSDLERRILSRVVSMRAVAAVKGSTTGGSVGFAPIGVKAGGAGVSETDFTTCMGPAEDATGGFCGGEVPSCAWIDKASSS